MPKGGITPSKRPLNAHQVASNKKAKQEEEKQYQRDYNASRPDRSHGSRKCVWHHCGKELIDVCKTQYVKIPQGKSEKQLLWRNKILVSLQLDAKDSQKCYLCTEHFFDNCIQQVEATDKAQAHARLVNNSHTHPTDVTWDALPHPRNGRATVAVPQREHQSENWRVRQLTDLLKRLEEAGGAPVTWSAEELKKLVELADTKRTDLLNEERDLKEKEGQQGDLEAMRLKIAELEKDVKKYKHPVYSWERLKLLTDAKFHSLVGIPTKEAFLAYHDVISKCNNIAPSVCPVHASSLHPFHACMLNVNIVVEPQVQEGKEDVKQRGRLPKLSSIDELIVSLLILRQGCELFLIAHVFDVDETTIGRIFRKWIGRCAAVNHILWPPITAQRVQRDYPDDWIEVFGNNRVIMVCITSSIVDITPSLW